MGKMLKRGVTLFFIAALTIVLLMIVYPLVHKTETLDAREVETDGKFITLEDGLTLHYVEAGSGEAIVLVHGFTSSVYTWKEVIPALAERHHVLAVDMMGFGLSDKPADATYNYKSFAAILKRFLDAKKIGKVTLVGNSMGGGISIRFALDYPSRVRRLVLVDSAGVVHGGPNMLSRLFATPGLNSLVSSVISEPVMRRSLEFCCFYDNDAVTRERVRAYVLPFRTKGAMNAAGRTAMQIDFGGLEEDLKNVAAPTLIIWGEKDRLIPVTAAGKFNRHIPNSRLVQIEKCGHMPQEEKPGRTAELILDFMK